MMRYHAPYALNINVPFIGKRCGGSRPYSALDFFGLHVCLLRNLIRPPRGGNFEIFSHENAQSEHKKLFVIFVLLCLQL
jgi:hypothetical protein